MELHNRPGWKRFVASPHYATVTTLSGAIAGLLGSVYGAEIADSFPLRLSAPFRVSLHAIAFWISLFVFAVLFYYRQRHDDAARARLEQTSDRITSLVQTLPPKAFRAQFAKAADATHAALS